MTNPFKHYQEYRRLKRFENTPMAMFPSIGEAPEHAQHIRVLEDYKPSEATIKLYKKKAFKPLWRD